MKPEIIPKKPFARIIRSMAAVALAAVAAVTCLLFLPACSAGGQESSLSMTVRHTDSSCSAVKKGVCVSKYSKTENANEKSAEKIEALGCGWWYNWAVEPANEYIAGAEFVPMMWGHWKRLGQDHSIRESRI